MEESGGQPDLIDLEGQTFYVDMSPESPKGRRSICYDKKARIKRKKNPPKTSAEEMAKKMGLDLITEDMYRKVQELEDLDRKTSTWLATPEAIRKLGGATFGDKRYGQTFVYHNGADSYYKARGVRFILTLPAWEKES